MVATKKRMLMITALLFGVLFAFFNPFIAEAGNNVIPEVTVGENGELNIQGEGFRQEGNAWNTLLQKYRNFIVGISGIGAITMIVIFIFHFLRLGGTAGNPQARTQAIIGLVWSGVAAAGLGAVTLIVGLFYNAIN